jgi:hypothetical protein
MSTGFWWRHFALLVTLLFLFVVSPGVRCRGTFFLHGLVIRRWLRNRLSWVQLLGRCVGLIGFAALVFGERSKRAVTANGKDFDLF